VLRSAPGSPPWVILGLFLTQGWFEVKSFFLGIYTAISRDMRLAIKCRSVGLASGARRTIRSRCLMELPMVREVVLVSASVALNGRTPEEDLWNAKPPRRGSSAMG
jgi:hypothetical protein